MKKRLIWVIIGLISLFIFSCEKKQESESVSSETLRFKLTKKWATTQELKVPESVLYDDARDILYISNINGSPLEKNSKGFISKVTLSGEIENLEWVAGLNAPKGSGIWQNKFYVTDIDELVEIDIETGKILNKYLAENAVFLNDVSVDDSGNVYVSDMSAENSVIYKFFNGKLEFWLQDEQISRPNGLFVENGKLFVGTGDGFLKRVDLKDKSISTFAETGFGIDGVQSDGKGNFLVSDWQGKTAFVSSSGEVKELMNTADSNINSADIEFIPDKQLLLIPTFFDNRVMAYLLA